MQELNNAARAAVAPLKRASQKKKPEWLPVTLQRGDWVVGYVRVSDPKQMEGLSLEEQCKAIERHCERMGFILAAVFIEPGHQRRQVQGA
jgi:hypothetical protein